MVGHRSSGILHRREPRSRGVHARVHARSTSVARRRSARSSAPPTGSRSTRSGSTCSPTRPATTSGSTSTSSARSDGPVRRHHRARLPHPVAGARASAARSSRLETPGAKLNYGVNKVRFPNPVRVGSADPRARHHRRGHRPARRQAGRPSATRSRSRARPSPPASPRRSCCCCREPESLTFGPLQCGMTRRRAQLTRSITSGAGVYGVPVRRDVVAAVERGEGPVERARARRCAG